VRPAAVPDALIVDVSAMRRRDETHASLERDLSPAWMRDALRDTDAEVDAGAHARVDLVVQGDGSVIVTGELRGGFQVPCARCLDPAAVDAGAQIAAMFVRDGAAHRLPDERDDPDAEQDDGGEELWPFDGIHLDLGPLLAETLKLAYPMRALCRRGAQCRGLCSQCGAPLNEQPADTPRCTACGIESPRVPEVDFIPSAEPPRTDALAEALRQADALKKLREPE
jgi:uncharacterized metal-binding protein YceD (DUF177 family)